MPQLISNSHTSVRNQYTLKQYTKFQFRTIPQAVHGSSEMGSVSYSHSWLPACMWLEMKTTLQRNAYQYKRNYQYPWEQYAGYVNPSCVHVQCRHTPSTLCVMFCYQMSEISHLQYILVCTPGHIPNRYTKQIYKRQHETDNDLAQLPVFMGTMNVSQNSHVHVLMQT